VRSRQDWVPVSRMWALALRLEPALLALGDLHNGAMRALRGVIRRRFLVLLTAAVVSGGAGLLLGPGWAAAGVVSGPLAVCAAGIIVAICVKPDPGQMLKAGRAHEALRLLEGDLAVSRRLAAKWPAFRDVLAEKLMLKSQALQALAREPQALDTAGEAVAIYAEFAARQPGRYNPALARALLQQAGLLGGLSRHGEALGATQAAIQIYRDLAAADRGTYLPDLALALARQSDELGFLDCIAEARAAAAEAELIRTDMLPPAPP